MKKNKGIQNSVIVFILIFMIGLFTVSCVGNHEQDEIIPVPIISPRPQQPIPSSQNRHYHLYIMYLHQQKK